VIGAHVRAGKDLVPALDRANDIGADVVQIFTQSPRAWKPTQYSDEVLDGYQQAQKSHPRVTATFCHASYLINLATGDRELLEKSRSCLLANLRVATGLGARGLVLHIGSHRGAGLSSCLGQIAESLDNAIDLVGTRCPILLENAAGAGGTVGRSFDELAQVLERCEHAVGVCLDTQHLWASGVPFGTIHDADAAIAGFDEVIGVTRLRCIHLNDSKVPFGANKDRHENIGDGTIGREGLGALLGHPALRTIPAILEVPGAGDGPRAEDVAIARIVVESGIRERGDLAT